MSPGRNSSRRPARTLSTRVLLAGPPGTGKSLAARTSGLAPGQRVLAVTLTEDTPAAELRGHWVPAGGDFRWQDGPTIAAWRGGHRLGLDEIDRASGAALTWLMGILDDFPTAMLTLPSGETLRPHSRFSVVATMNGDPAVDLRPALRDRFPVAIHVDAIHPAALAQLPDDLRAVAMTTTFAAEPDRQASVRRWQEFARLREHLGEEMAARACFDPRAEELLTALRVARG